MSVIDLMVFGFYSYLIIGFVLGIAIILRGLNSIDPTTVGSPISFKLIILPGVVALWPMLIKRMINSPKHD